jgi:hypothetical protein
MHSTKPQFDDFYIWQPNFVRTRFENEIMSLQYYLRPRLLARTSPSMDLAVQI